MLWLSPNLCRRWGWVWFDATYVCLFFCLPDLDACVLVYRIKTNASRLWVRHLRKLATKIKEYTKEYIYITKEFWEKSIQFHGTVHGLKITNWTVKHLPTKAVWWDAPLTHRDFSQSNMHDHSTRIQGLHWFISFTYTRPFD